MFIYSFDNETTTILKNEGLKVIQETDEFVMFKSSKEVTTKFANLEGIHISNKIRF